MNSPEKSMLYEIHLISSAVPRKGKQGGGIPTQRDHLQLQHFIKSLTYDLFMYGMKTTDNKDSESSFNSALEEAHMFINFRENEKWLSPSEYLYTTIECCSICESIEVHKRSGDKWECQCCGTKELSLV